MIKILHKCKFYFAGIINGSRYLILKSNSFGVFLKLFSEDISKNLLLRDILTLLIDFHRDRASFPIELSFFNVNMML